MGLLVVAALSACGRRLLTENEFHTDRLVMQEVADVDLGEIQQLLNDPYVSKYIRVMYRYADVFIYKATVERKKPRKNWSLAIRRKTDDKLLGFCRVRINTSRDTPPSTSFVFIGEEQNTGYDAEIGAGLTDFASFVERAR